MSIEKLDGLIAEMRLKADATDVVAKGQLDDLSAHVKSEIAAIRSDMAAQNAPREDAQDTAEIHQKAVAEFMVHGSKMVEAGKIKATDYAVSVSADGGITVPTNIHTDVVEKLRKSSPLLGLSTVTSLKGLQKLLLKTSAAQANTRSERGAFTDNTVEGFAGITLGSKDVYDRQAHTVESVEGDSVLDFQQVLLASMNAGIAEKMASELLNSTVTNAVENVAGTTTIPAGILNRVTEVAADRFTGSIGKTPCLTTAGINLVTFEDMIKLYNSLHTKYRNSATFVTGSDIELQLMLVKDSTGNYIWQPAVGQTYQAVIQGRPVVIDDFMPGVTGSAGVPRVLFADFSENYVNFSGPMQWVVDPYTAPGYVKYTARQRFGSVFRDSQAIRGLLLKTS
uniref:Phage major capsid protein, HK97 family n=1 Tax=Caulobacter sp. (strain K31) TaxID=366602 RepID=B0T632_CAUSK